MKMTKFPSSHRTAIFLVAAVTTVLLGGRSGAETLNFDEFAPGFDSMPIPSGYGNLQWDNFGVYCGACRSLSEGYRTGTVSPRNVAFNVYGDPASISSSNTFDLKSAWLTAALNLDTPLDIRVQGFRGGSALYDQTVRVTRSAPTLATFDFASVDRVTFTTSPAQQFAMDDLVIASTQPCDFALAPGGRAHGGGSETGSVSVVAPEGCAWTVSNTNAWVTILSAPTNSGSGAVTYAVAENSSGLERRGFLEIAGQGFSLSQLPAAHDPVRIGPIEVSTIGHFAFVPPLYPPAPIPGHVPPATVYADFLIDQDQFSGGGAVLPDVSVNWDTNTDFAVTISAPAGKKFSVHVPAGEAVGFAGQLMWESTRGGFSPAGAVSVSFDGLEGAAPAFTGSDSVLSSSHGYFGITEITGPRVSNDFAFRSMTLTGSAVPQYTGNGTEDYVPHHASSLQVVCACASDPGPLVSIVAAGPGADPDPALSGAPAASLSIASLSPTAGATLRQRGGGQRSQVVEYSEDLRHWTPLGTNVAGTITDPGAAGAARRFYRVRPAQ